MSEIQKSIENDLNIIGGFIIMWIFILFCLVIGGLIGVYMPYMLPVFMAKYLSVAILAGLDSLFGGLRANLESNFDSTILLTGFIANSLLAAGLAYVGDQLSVSLYTAAVFVFGVRIFQNLAIIRRILLDKFRNKPEVDLPGVDLNE
jgi:small basic protein